MKAPIIWLKDFTDIDVEPKVLGDAMTMTGSKVRMPFRQLMAMQFICMP